jgi:hypothetical protein
VIGFYLYATADFTCQRTVHRLFVSISLDSLYRSFVLFFLDCSNHEHILFVGFCYHHHLFFGKHDLFRFKKKEHSLEPLLSMDFQLRACTINLISSPFVSIRCRYERKITPLEPPRGPKGVSWHLLKRKGSYQLLSPYLNTHITLPRITPIVTYFNYPSYPIIHTLHRQYETHSLRNMITMCYIVLV